MKKLLFALTILASFVVATPRAEAGQYRKIYTPYGVQYVNKYSGAYPSYHHARSQRHYRHYGNYRSHRHSSHYRSYPVYRTSYRSYPVYRSSYRSYPRYYNSGHCDTGYRSSSYYSSRPRISVSFGF